MRKPEDFPLQDETKDYCVHCARVDGSMQSYGERLAGMADFIVRTQGLDGGVALDVARDLMSRLPAWAGQR
jgi:hypothetical protein